MLGNYVSLSLFNTLFPSFYYLLLLLFKKKKERKRERDTYERERERQKTYLASMKVIKPFIKQLTQDTSC